MERRYSINPNTYKKEIETAASIISVFSLICPRQGDKPSWQEFGLNPSQLTLLQELFFGNSRSPDFQEHLGVVMNDISRAYRYKHGANDIDKPSFRILENYGISSRKPALDEPRRAHLLDAYHPQAGKKISAYGMLSPHNHIAGYEIRGVLDSPEAAYFHMRSPEDIRLYSIVPADKVAVSPQELTDLVMGEVEIPYQEWEIKNSDDRTDFHQIGFSFVPHNKPFFEDFFLRKISTPLTLQGVPYEFWMRFHFGEAKRYSWE